MTDDPIRALLAELEPSNFIRTDGNRVAIVRSRVVEAGGDPETVAAWVEQHGGYVDQTPDYVSKGFGPTYGRVTSISGS